jgi:alkylhydroperoxidase/carboxymuconolactone decarboxylase family protein YurZ
VPAAKEPKGRFTFPFEADLNDVAPGLLRAQNAWLSQIDSLPAPDRKTHELIRMVCSVVARNPLGIRRHAMLAAEVGATWEEVAGSVILAGPAFGILVVVEAFPWARKGWERGSSLEDDDEAADPS